MYVVIPYSSVSNVIIKELKIMRKFRLSCCRLRMKLGRKDILNAHNIETIRKDIIIAEAMHVCL